MRGGLQEREINSNVSWQCSNEQEGMIFTVISWQFLFQFGLSWQIRAQPVKFTSLPAKLPTVVFRSSASFQFCFFFLLHDLSTHGLGLRYLENSCVGRFGIFKGHFVQRPQKIDFANFQFSVGKKKVSIPHTVRKAFMWNRRIMHFFFNIFFSSRKVPAREMKQQRLRRTVLLFRSIFAEVQLHIYDKNVIPK